MTKTRLEAFSDGVIAIIITIMVLELKAPHHADWEALKSLLPEFVSYILSFIVVGIYWGNHHHLLHTVNHINSKMIWANFLLLFWLSLIPIATAWMGENNFTGITVATYAILLDLCGIAYYILLLTIEGTHPHNSDLFMLLKKQSRKGMLSLVLYSISIPIAFFYPLMSASIFLLVTILWWIPDRNIEKSIKGNEQ